MALGSLVANLTAMGFGSITANIKRKKLEKKINSGIVDKEDLIWLSSYYVNKKDFFKAESYAKRLLEMIPNEPAPKNILFNIYFTKRDYKKAIYQLEHLIQNGKELDTHYFNLGYCYFLLGDIEKSNEFKAKAESIDPEVKKYKYKKI